MSEQTFNRIGSKLQASHNATSGKMFGKPCLKGSNNKALAAFFKGEMVFKLGAEEIHLLRDRYPGSVKWDPSGKGRPMKDWLQVPAAFEEDWEKLAIQAVNFVTAQG